LLARDCTCLHFSCGVLPASDRLMLSRESCLPCANMSQQPTDFWLDTFTIREVFDTPGLVTSLAQYSEQQLQQDDRREPKHCESAQSATAQSILLLRIQAAASYYSTNRTLMEHPEPVNVDISMS
jgi:hypothetical protein